MAAHRVRSILGEELWRDYFTFTIERNPHDKAVSLLYWRRSSGRVNPATPTADTIDIPALSNWALYASPAGLDVDFVIRYEHLATDLEVISTRIGAAVHLPGYRAKGMLRPQRASQRTVLDERARRVVERRCMRETGCFGYEW